MSDSNGEDQPQPVDLATLIASLKGDLSYEDLATRSGGVVTRQTWHALANPRRRKANLPDPPTIEAVARAFGIPVRTVVLAAATSVGLDVGSAEVRFADRLPPSVDELGDVEREALLTLVRALVAKPARPGILADLEPDQPAAPADPPMRLVAKKASATDKARRAANDQHAE